MDFDARRQQWDQDLERYKRDINLVQLAMDRGYELKRDKSTRRAKVLKHTNGDRILVSQSIDDGHWVYHSLGGDDRDRGTIVDFLLHRDARDMREVHAACRMFLGQPREIRPDQRIDPSDLHFDRDKVIARFLRAQIASNSRFLNERGIRPETLTDARFRETWRIDGRGNVLFPHRDDEGLCGYEVKNHHYTSFAKQATKTVWRSRALEGDDRLVVTESAIESMSYFQLHQPRTARFMSVGGCWSPSGLAQLLKSTARLPDGARVVLAFNADAEGRKLADQLQPEVAATGRDVARHFPTREGADWNDLLKLRERAYLAELAQRSPQRARATREPGMGVER